MLLKINSDTPEIKQLLGQATRSRVKQCLEIQQRRFETELIALKEKQEQTAAPSTEKKPATTTLSSSTARSYTKEITLYGKRNRFI